MSLIMLLSVVTVSGFTVSARVPDSANVEQVTYDGTREIEFNDNWQFYLATRTPEVAGGSGASGFRDYGIKDAGDYTTDEIISVDFDDSSWRTLSVPHDFSIEGEKVPESNTSQGYMLGGLGWYRKTFTVPESLRENGKRVLIDFEDSRALR